MYGEGKTPMRDAGGPTQPAETSKVKVLAIIEAIVVSGSPLNTKSRSEA
jgi:hypothetical protein